LMEDNSNENKIELNALIQNIMIGYTLDEDSIVSSRVQRWFQDYFSDSNKMILPRDILSFFRKIKEACINNIDQYYNEISYRIFPMNLICTREIYYSIAEEKLEHLCKKYEKENLCNVISAIKDTKEINFPINSYEFVVKVGKSMVDEKSEIGMEQVDLLVQLGVLEKKNEELNMKPIYLEVFDKRSSKYSFRF